MARLEKQLDDVFLHRREAGNVQLGPDVAKFCRQHNLHDDVSLAIALANSTFTGISGLTSELEIDPDTDEERVILHLLVNAPIEDVVKARKAYSRKWIDSAPPAVREKIVLLYHISN